MVGGGSPEGLGGRRNIVCDVRIDIVPTDAALALMLSGQP